MAELDTDDGIYPCIEAPYRYRYQWNVIRPGVLRQYFGKDQLKSSTYVNRYTYGGLDGSAASTVGISKDNFKTRPFTTELDNLSTKLHKLLYSDKTIATEILRSRSSAHPTQKCQFNHCTILMYYGIENVKKVSKLGIHCDCVYNKKGDFIKKSNSQKENTVTVSLTLGDTHILNHFERYVFLDKDNPVSKWIINKNDWVESFLVDGTLTVIHPHDERPFYFKRNGHKTLTQIQHGDVSVGKGKWSCSIVFRTVTSVSKFDNKSNLLVKEQSGTVSSTMNSSKEHSKRNVIHYDELYEKHKEIQKLYLERVNPHYEDLNYD